MLSLKCLTAICRQARCCLYICWHLFLLCLIKIMICFLKHKSTLSRPLWTFFSCEGTLWPVLPTRLHARLFWQPVNLYYNVLSCIQCHYFLFVITQCWLFKMSCLGVVFVYSIQTWLPNLVLNVTSRKDVRCAIRLQRGTLFWWHWSWRRWRPCSADWNRYCSFSHCVYATLIYIINVL